MKTFAKNYRAVGCKLDYMKADGDLSNYTPDFWVKTTDGTVWVVETKGREELDLPQKMNRLKQYCEDATAASRAEGGPAYGFVYVDQESFERNPPKDLRGLLAAFREFQTWPAPRCPAPRHRPGLQNALKLITIVLYMRAKNVQMPTDPVTLLFGAYHQRLLGLLLMRPEQSFHLREIERLTGVPSGPAHRELKRMQRAGLLTAVRVGNQVRYQANRGSPIFVELSGIMRKTSGLADVLRDALAPLSDRIDVAFVFGSVARGEEGSHSDVDLMVVGDAGFDEVVGVLHPLHERLGREVNAVVMKPAEFRRRARESSFVARVLSGKKLMLLGALDES